FHDKCALWRHATAPASGPVPAAGGCNRTGRDVAGKRVSRAGSPRARGVVAGNRGAKRFPRRSVSANGARARFRAGGNFVVLRRRERHAEFFAPLRSARGGEGRFRRVVACGRSWVRAVGAGGSAAEKPGRPSTSAAQRLLHRERGGVAGDFSANGEG